MVTVGLDVEGLSEAQGEVFLAERRVENCTSLLSLRALGPLLGFLRSVGATPERVVVGPVGPVEELVDAYRCWLVEERALAVPTVERCGRPGCFWGRLVLIPVLWLRLMFIGSWAACALLGVWPR